MGRGTRRNLCTELLTQHINHNYDRSYNIIPILKIIDKQINPIFAKNTLGIFYSILFSCDKSLSS